MIFSPSASEGSPWTEAGELYRRICLLRTRGQAAEAARLQSTELAKAIARIRESDPDGAGCDAKIGALFARETERVADAGVLAEILVGLLREAGPSEIVPAAFASRARSVVPTPLASRRPAGTVPGIADFIDQMIQQETTAPAAPVS